MLPVVQLLKQANDNNDEEELITPIRVNKNQKKQKNHLDILITTDDGTKFVLASDDPQDEQQHVTLLNNNNKLSSKTMFTEHDGDVGTTATVVVDAAAAKETKMDFPVIKTTTTTKSTLINKSSLPETLDVIDENSSFSSSSSASSSSTSSPRKPIKTQMIEQSVYNNYHCSMKTYESGMGSRKKWPIKQLRSQQQKTAISTFRSNSETSSVVSTCSSSESETHNDFTNDATLSHDVSPDSPDSGVSGSVNSTDDKCSDEDSDDFFQIVYDKTNNLQYVGNNVDNFTTCSLLNLIPPEHDQIKEIVDEHPKPETDDENVQKKQLATDEEELTEAPENQETTDSDKQIDNHDCSVSSDSSEVTIIKTASDDDDDEFERELFKEVAALVPTLSKSFDEILNVLKRGPAKEPEKDEQNEEKMENDEPGACSPLHFNLDCSSENSSATHLNETNYTQSFDWSIKTQGASDMQSMIKEIKMNARNLKNNELNKKPQIFICQWHDCDWPGNYEDLADHLREIHVELQPFLDANGKVIKWNKKANKTRREDELISDDFDGTSQTTLDSDEEEDDDNNNDSATDDDTQSSRLVTRGSKRLRTQFASSFKTNHKNSSKTSTRRRKKNSTVAETEKFVCLWRDCKVYGKPSLSRNWIERHVLEQHSGPKPFKCIVDNCGQRFRTQNQMEKHVNMHFKPSNGNPVTDLKLLMNNHHPNHNNNKPPIFNHNQNNGKTIGSSKDSCCYCHCHSNCDSKFYDDTSTSTLSGKNRLDKTNRSSSVDSGISLQSCSSSISEAFPSTSSSSSSSSSLTKCLSKSKKIEHCHSSCCFLNKSISLDFKSSKILRNNKKKTNLNFKAKKIPHDYLDDEFALRVAFELQARDAFRSNVDHYSPYEKWIQFPDGSMQKLQHPKKGESINDVIDRLKKRLSSPFKVVNVFQEELFHMDRMDKSSFKTDLIACKIRSDNQFYYTCRSRLPGLMEDRNIPESRIHKPRTCNERFAPKSFSLASLCRKNTKCDKQKESKIGKRSRTDPRPYDYTRLEFVPVETDSEDEGGDSTGGNDPPDEEFNGDEDDDNEENWIEVDDDSDEDCVDLADSEDHTSENSIVVLEDEDSQNESDDDDDCQVIIDPSIAKNSTSDEEMNANDPPTRRRGSKKRRNIQRNRKEEEEEEISTIKKRLRKR